jgi:nucleoside-diphosphate-sugar epimerase
LYGPRAIHYQRWIEQIFATGRSQVGAIKKNRQSLVIGGTGLVGGYIVDHLLRGGERPSALSRSEQTRPGVEWIRGDLKQPHALELPPFATVYCSADATLLADAVPRLFNPS